MANHNAQGFSYQPGRSTANIFSNGDNGFLLSTLPWHSTPIPAPISINGPVTICSSASGFILCRVDAFSSYYIGNPFAQHQPCYRGPLLPPPTDHPRHDTNVVLAVEQRPEVMHPIFHIICAIRRDPSIYDFHTFSSTTRQWASHPGINLQQQREIVPNTGVSCGRFAYWLTQNPRSVLRFDIAGNPEMISFLELPRVIPPAEQVRMQLGRAGDSLGLVIVSETESTVELYARPLATESLWVGPAGFNVEIQADANIECRPGDESTLVFKEMPTPMRFESFKMESLLWVSGEVVVLEESCTAHESLYRIGAFSVVDAPETFIDSLPHVCNPLLPLVFHGD